MSADCTRWLLISPVGLSSFSDHVNSVKGNNIFERLTVIAAV